MPKVRILMGAAVLLLAAGCSSGSSSSAPSAAPTTEVASPAAETPASPGPCPDGAYVITALEGRGDASAIGKGTGGNIGVKFASGTFTISSDGSEPVKLEVGPTGAELRFDGSIAGTYSGDADALRLTTTSATGDVSVKGFGVSRTESADGLSDQLIGKGVTGQVTCDDAAGTAVVLLPSASLTLTRS